jgi:hypothetical protein
MKQTDLAEGDPDMLAQRLVVIAGDEYDLGSMAGALEDLLDHRIVACRPENPSAHGPEVSDVADQEQVLGLVLAQELQQALCLTGTRSQVDIGKKNGADFSHTAS